MLVVGKVVVHACEGRGEGLRFLEEANFITNEIQKVLENPSTDLQHSSHLQVTQSVVFIERGAKQS